MRNETTVSKWGNSLAVRIPQAIAKEARLNEGDCLALDLDRDGSIVLRPARRRYELSELVSRITSKNRHRETDWGQGLAPGSYISIFGSDLSDTTLVESTQSLPVSLGLVSVSFDGGGMSLPGHFHFISPGQINVQIPWEFQGQSSVQMKVTLYGYLWSALYTVPLATYSPGIFAVADGVNNAVRSEEHTSELQSLRH